MAFSKYRVCFSYVRSPLSLLALLANKYFVSGPLELLLLLFHRAPIYYNRVQAKVMVVGNTIMPSMTSTRLTGMMKVRKAPPAKKKAQKSKKK